MKRRLIGGILAAGAVAGLVLFLRLGPRERGPSSSQPAAAPGRVVPPGAVRSEATGPAAGPAEEPSHLADDLNLPGGDIHADLRILGEIFRQFRSSTRGLNPIGDNREITAALTGRNRLDFSFIPPHHPAINAHGELSDRWGTPFFFHQLSGIQMEIRSAGPDRRLWTDDDEVLAPERNAPPR